ncbi:hypothetical protein Ate01nite_40070 [Actinoplanes teichomyceticus]|nr:hypothetical protein Ate01nite_40070 [Actinoplanes teichomyceticus]
MRIVPSTRNNAAAVISVAPTLVDMLIVVTADPGHAALLTDGLHARRHLTEVVTARATLPAVSGTSRYQQRSPAPPYCKFLSQTQPRLRPSSLRTQVQVLP